MEILYTDKDGNQIKFTEEMLVDTISERDLLKEKVNTLTDEKIARWEKVISIRGLVFNFFNERYDSGASTIECEVEDVNELLKDIGADLLKRLFTVKGSIDFVVTDVEAEDEEDARSAVEDNLRLESDIGNLDDWSFSGVDADEQ